MSETSVSKIPTASFYLAPTGDSGPPLKCLADQEMFISGKFVQVSLGMTDYQKMPSVLGNREYFELGVGEWLQGGFQEEIELSFKEVILLFSNDLNISMK